jgi:hypothetical protein
MQQTLPASRSRYARLLLVMAACVSIVASSALYAQAVPDNKTPVIAAGGAGIMQPDQPAVETPVGAPSVMIGGKSLVSKIDRPSTDPETPQVKSLFFTQEEMSSMRKALNVYAKITSGEGESNEAMDFLRRLQGGDKPKANVRYFVYPQFHLESLVYNNSEDWSVRINKQKMTPANPEGKSNIKVTSVDKDKITVEWIPTDMQKVVEVWSVSPTDTIEVNTKSNLVRFTLRPNQTFSSYVMRVLEGKVVPMVIDLAKGSDKTAAESIDKAAPKSAESNILDELMGKVGSTLPSKK